MSLVYVKPKRQYVIKYTNKVTEAKLKDNKIKITVEVIEATVKHNGSDGTKNTITTKRKRQKKKKKADKEG